MLLFKKTEKYSHVIIKEHPKIKNFLDVSQKKSDEHRMIHTNSSDTILNRYNMRTLFGYNMLNVMPNWEF